MGIDLKKESPNHPDDNPGFVLPFVVVVGLILIIGSMSLMMRGFANLIGAKRQGSSEAAKAIAETGMARILKTLNLEYPYLLTSDCQPIIDSESSVPRCQEWHEPNQDATYGTFSFRTSTCPGRTLPPSTVFEQLQQNTPSGDGRYALLEYSFIGDANQGGVSTIKVKGEKLNSAGDVQSTAYIQQEVNIVPKNCNLHSGFPGILGEAVLLHKTDVEGDDELDINGNVLCLDCPASSTKDELAKQMEVDEKSNLFSNRDKLFGGIIAMPRVPEFPTQNQATAQEAEIIDSPSLLTALYRQGNCWLEKEKLISHCKIANINLSGDEELVMNTKAVHCDSVFGFGPATAECGSNGQVRLYVSGNITLAGKARISNVDCDKDSISECENQIQLHPADMGIFGPANTDQVKQDPFKDDACTGRENVVLNGSAKGGTNAFIFMPNACIRVNGGSGSPDFHGAVWSYKFEPSNSLNIDVQVPDDMGNRLYRLFGSDFALAIREFSARGSNRWSLVQP